MKHILRICFAVLLVMSAVLLISCGEEKKPSGATYDFMPEISKYEIVYPDGNKDLKAAALRINEALLETAGVELSVVSSSEYAGTNDHIITLGDVGVEADEADALMRRINRESNTKYGAFSVAFEGWHIYLLGDSDKSISAAADFLCETYVKDDNITIPAPDEENVINHFSKTIYSVGKVSKAIVKEEDLKKRTSVLNIAPAANAEYLSFQKAKSGDIYYMSLSEKQKVPSFVCEAESPFSKTEIGKYNSSTKSIVITVTAGDNSAKKEYKVEFVFVNSKYQSNFSADTIADAMGVENVRFLNEKGNYDWEVEGASALFTLALHEYDHPGSKSGNGVVATRILSHLRSAITAGQEPQMYVGPWWANPTFACAVAIVKQTPTVWSQLAEGEIERLDWLMRGYAVTTNFAANTKNNFTTGPELVGNYNKGWNPNFRSSNLIQILACVSYFGTADAVNDILTSFSYDEYIKKYKELKFSNIVESWTKGDRQNGSGFVKNLMEKGAGKASDNGSGDFTYKDDSGNTVKGGYGVGVKVPFTYKIDESNGRDIPLADVGDIFNCLILNLYSMKVVSKYGEAHTLNNEVSPYEGQMGMMKEYNSGDAGGVRSDAAYCTHNFSMIIPGLAAFTKLGLWNPESVTNKALHNQIYVGNEDHIFKMTVGYQSYSKGQLTGPHIAQEGEISVYSMTKAIWQEFVITFITYKK